MKNSYTSELQKLYDDTRVCPLLQEVCEYYASRQDYEDGSYIEEIEPREIVEPVYMLLLLQRRESIIDELSYVMKHYPHLYKGVCALHEEILINMDIRPLEEECSVRLSNAIEGKYSPTQIIQKIEELADNYEEMSEALDPFYSWLHRSLR